MNKKFELAILVLIMLIIFPTTTKATLATDVGNLTMDATRDASDVGSDMISRGINNWFYSVGDSMIDTASGGNGTVDRAETPGLIFRMLSYTIDPFKLSFVAKWQGTMMIFYLLVVFAFVIEGGMASALIHSLSPTSHRTMRLVAGGRDIALEEWVSRLVLSVLLFIFTIQGISWILQLNYVITALFTESALNIVPFTTNNVILYLFMAGGYFLMGVIMAIRNLVIVLFAVGGYGLAALYLIPQLDDFIGGVFWWILGLIFMQPLLIFIASVGLLFVTQLPPELFAIFPLMYFALILVLAVVAVVMLIGPHVIYSLLNGARKVIS